MHQKRFLFRIFQPKFGTNSRRTRLFVFRELRERKRAASVDAHSGRPIQRRKCIFDCRHSVEVSSEKFVWKSRAKNFFDHNGAERYHWQPRTDTSRSPIIRNVFVCVFLCEFHFWHQPWDFANEAFWTSEICLCSPRNISSQHQTGSFKRVLQIPNYVLPSEWEASERLRTTREKLQFLSSK